MFVSDLRDRHAASMTRTYLFARVMSIVAPAATGHGEGSGLGVAVGGRSTASAGAAGVLSCPGLEVLAVAVIAGVEEKAGRNQELQKASESIHPQGDIPGGSKGL